MWVEEQFIALARTPSATADIIKTAILLIVLLLIRAFVVHNVQSWRGMSSDAKLRWTVNARNLTVVFFFIGFLIIWGHQLKEFALSVAALALATVLMFKEMIANFMGGFSRAISDPFTIGDRIEVGIYRGDVIDQDMLSTKILEIGPGRTSHQYTGSTISIPNSVFLASPVINESFMHEYLLHVFKVPVKNDNKWEITEGLLLQAARDVCDPYLERARIYMERLSQRLNVDPPSADPRISIVFTKPDEIELLVRVPVPSKRKGRIEQDIIRRYLELRKSASQNEMEQVGR